MISSRYLALRTTLIDLAIQQVRNGVSVLLLFRWIWLYLKLIYWHNVHTTSKLGISFIEIKIGVRDEPWEVSNGQWTLRNDDHELQQFRMYQWDTIETIGYKGATLML